MMRKSLTTLAFFAALAATAGTFALLHNDSQAGPPPSTAAPSQASQAAASAVPPAVGPPLTPHPELPPERRALLIQGEREIWVDADEAVRAGYTLVDLGDDWTPFLFTDAVQPDGTRLTNRYRTIYLGLANDTGDDDGQPLQAGEHNYLEVFGIPPSLSVLRARFLADAANPCADVDLTQIQAAKTVPTSESSGAKKATRRTPEQQAAFTEIEKRLGCEQLFPKRPRHTPGRFDDAMRTALVRFQLKNKLYDAAAFRPETLRTLGRAPLDNDYDALVRTLAERVVAAADVLEDGSAVAEDGGGPPTYLDANGQRHEVRDLVGEALRAALQQLGFDGPQAALRFFQRHEAAAFKALRVAVRLPPAPDYYSNQMDLTVEIDRGDVIYEPPFDPNGKPNPLSRQAFPSLVLRTNYRGQRVPLVKWRTTIGGWRSEQAPNGYEYYRYKGSDVGPRIWRHIVSAPVWIAPNSTPLRSLVKTKNVNGTSQLVVNYDELGPGYLSAYGLVVAYNVEPGRDGKPDGDNGVRVHGSSEYRSIRNTEGYSHGCHRLLNHLAVRMFSFVLRHRNVLIDGERRLGFHRQFLWKDEVYELRLPSRGFWYTLEPPIAVNVLEGNIVGRVKKPFVQYIPKPGVAYPPGTPPPPPDTPEGRAAGGGE
ncbi:MAG TPA: hypothetical protein VH877_15120 [Polyangia bacterium]|jgi:hypothetical protein|nr:hypothetical protein [Polyangia bacterium]